jgi:hypothetical protein
MIDQRLDGGLCHHREIEQQQDVDGAARRPGEVVQLPGQLAQHPQRALGFREPRVLPLDHDRQRGRIAAWGGRR